LVSLRGEDSRVSVRKEIRRGMEDKVDTHYE